MLLTNTEYRGCHLCQLHIGPFGYAHTVDEMLYEYKPAVCGFFVCFLCFTAEPYLNCFLRVKPVTALFSCSFSLSLTSAPPYHQSHYLGHAEHLALPWSLVLLLPDRVTVFGSESLTAFSSLASMFSTKHLTAASILVFSYNRQMSQIRTCFRFSAYYSAATAYVVRHNNLQ